MCDYCIHIVGTTYPTHTPTLCPYMRSKHCSYCSVFGHMSSECPNTSFLHSRPQFLEQLIPQQYIQKYNITTTTSIQYNDEQIIGSDTILEIECKNNIIQKYLSNHSIPPSKKIVTNIQKLLQYGNNKNIKIVFI